MSSITASISGHASSLTNLFKLNFNLVDSLKALAQGSGVELL